MVWHQTDYDGLKAILSGKAFKPSYSLETIACKGSVISVAFPMVSFCDIPFADLTEYLTNNDDGKYTGKYGKYTIGMKRSWGRKVGLSPVWYRDTNATSLHQQMKAFKEILKENKPFEMNEEKQRLWYTMANTKNMQGRLSKYGFEAYRFADEKELRLVPTFEQLKENGIAPFIKVDDGHNLKDLNPPVIPANFDIPFQEDDVAYILFSSLGHRKRIQGLCGQAKDQIVFLSYSQVIQDIIGDSHNREL